MKRSCWKAFLRIVFSLYQITLINVVSERYELQTCENEDTSDKCWQVRIIEPIVALTVYQRSGVLSTMHDKYRTPICKLCFVMTHHFVNSWKLFGYYSFWQTFIITETINGYNFSAPCNLLKVKRILNYYSTLCRSIWIICQTKFIRRTNLI